MVKVRDPVSSAIVEVPGCTMVPHPSVSANVQLEGSSLLVGMGGGHVL